jgi:DNA repair protein RecO (recombination protein O)
MKGIVLSGIKYTDNRDIVYLYTDVHGRKTFILNRRKRHHGLFPLSLIEFEPSGRRNLEMLYVKEFVFAPLLPDIASDVRKSSIAMFLGEFLYRILKEEDSSREMFDYLTQSILLLNELRNGIANFHLYFMVQLSRYVGFSIPTNREEYDYFDIRQSRFVFIKPMHLQFFDPANTRILSCLSGLTVDRLDELKLTGDERRCFANSMLDFYSCRFDHTLIVKSLNVLHEIFS